MTVSTRWISFMHLMIDVLALQGPRAPFFAVLSLPAAAIV